MIWLNPLALIGLGAVAAPILIHILVRRRAERFPFPTLRFIQPTRLAAIRRHVLEDVALLAVRVAVLAVAVAALAGPLVVTAARLQAWDRRVVRAIVVDAVPTDIARAFPASEPPFRSQRFDAASLPDGVRRAVAWLETAPPGRRELVVVSPFAIGSMTAADVAAIPQGVGITFKRSGALPAVRTVLAGRVLTASESVAREATLNGSQTIVRETGVPERASWPIDVVAPPAAQRAVDAAIAAVLSQRVWEPPPDRRARLVLLEPASEEAVAQAFRPAIDDAAPIRQPWMADAVARIASDRELQTAASRVATRLRDARFAAAPWQSVAFAADGRALAVATGSPGQLVVVSAAPVADVVTPLLMRAMVNGIALVSDLQRAEVAPIPDRLLHEWSRPAALPGVPRVHSPVGDDDFERDRRWFWLAVLCLLAIETWVRRGRSAVAATEDSKEAARVA